MKISTIKLKKKNTSILYLIKNKLIKRINKIDQKGYLHIFILGEKNILDEEILNNYQEEGVSHLFSLSGMHISLLAGIILYILNKISYNYKMNYLTIILFLLFYLFITDYPPSLIRATILYILLALNKSYSLKIKTIDLLLIVLIIVITINPFYIYNIGFQYSYIISISLIIFNKKIDNKLLKSLYISILCFLISLPITIYNFYQINTISILLNIILIPIVSIIVYPLSLTVLLIPKLNIILTTIMTILEHIIKITNSINIFKIILSKPNIVVIVIYYITIIIAIYKPKYIYILIIIIIIHKNINHLNKETIITILDVGQGDSILIKYPHNKSNILIDTGGVTGKESNIVKSKTIPYLKSLGINSLSALIITHGDFDHGGEAIYLVNNFKVDKVIFNCGSYNDLEKELIKVLDKKKIKYYSCIKELNIDKNKLYFLQTKEYDNENDNSNVIYTELDGYKFMFMGDASRTTEKEILSKYNLQDIDILKLGHHGSKTSSSREFINEVNPNYSIISVGKNNRYGHPNKEVLNNLDKSKIYRTDEDGSIMFKIKNNKLKIETCAP